MYRTMIATVAILLAVLIMLPAVPARADESGRIAGNIMDAETEEALLGVSVVVEGTNHGAATDAEGVFEITHVHAGDYRLIISLVGYRATTQEVTVVNNETARVAVDLEESPLEIGGVVVTGTRTPRFIKDVPVFTEVITNKTIEDKAAKSLYEALDGTPGIRVEQQCQGCNFSVLRMQGLGADHTQILQDGQPVYSGLAGVYGLQQLSTAEIDRIEVVKGAGSALYGSNAIAGAINIISAMPRKTEAKVGMQFGEYGTNNYDITAGTRNGDIALFLFAQQNQGKAIDVSGDGMNSDEVDGADGDADRVKSSAKNAGFNLFIDNVVSDDRLTVRGRILSENRQGGTIVDDVYENPFTEGTERIITDRYSAEFGYWRHFRNAGEVNFDFSFTRHKRNATNDTFLGDYVSANGEEPPIEELRPYLADENLYIATLNYVHPLGRKHRLLVGGQYTRNELSESGKYVIVDEGDPDFGYSYTSYSDKHADEVGAYVQDELAVSDDLEVVMGVRFDYHKSEDAFGGSGTAVPVGIEPVNYDETTVNPRFAVKYDLSEDLTLRGNFGTGFRAPYGFSEDLHLCSGSPRVWKSGDLKPEKSVSYSVTADYTAAVWSMSVNLYRTELKHAIAFTDASENATLLGYTYEWENIDDAQVMGAEFSTKVGLTSDLAAAMDLAFYSGEYDGVRQDWVGTPYEEISRNIPRYPQTAGGFKVEYTPKLWSVVLSGEYKGKMFIDYFKDGEGPTKIKETESFLILNGQVSKTVLGNCKLSVGVKNLTDYVQEERHTDDAAFMYAPVYGRIVYAGVQFALK